MWVPDRNSEAIVQDETSPQSYEVETNEGYYRRNRRDLIQLPEQPAQEVEMPAASEAEQTETSSRRSDRTVQPPKRYDPSWA